MNVFEDIKRAAAEFFRLLDWAWFRAVIVLLAIIFVMLAFTEKSDADTLAPVIKPVSIVVTKTGDVEAEDFEDEVSSEVVYWSLVAATAPPPKLKPEYDQYDLFGEEDHPNEYCLALNIYYESRADNLAGKYAVADVVLNRVADKRFPGTVCDVVYEAVMYESWATKQDPDLPDEERVYFPRKHQCQFSWYCDGLPDVPENREAWRNAQLVAYNILQFDRFRGITEGATHYHATYVTPYWSTAFDLIGRIGSHVFYRWSYKPKKQ